MSISARGRAARRTGAGLLVGALGLLLWLRRPPPAVTTASDAWPHEPAGFEVFSDQPWAQSPSPGWTPMWGESAVVRDSTAPLSPPGVLEIVYPPGFAGGSAPATQAFELPRRGGGVRQLYIGIWWKASESWEGHPSNVNKIQFLFPKVGGDMTMVMYGSPGGPYALRTALQFRGADPRIWLEPNVGAGEVTPGAWHRIEWLIGYHTTRAPANGICRWWIDGKLVGDYWDVLYPAEGMIEYKLSPTWGGIGGVKRRGDFYRIDHIRVSGRRGG